MGGGVVKKRKTSRSRTRLRQLAYKASTVPRSLGAAGEHKFWDTASVSFAIQRTNDASLGYAPLSVPNISALLSAPDQGDNAQSRDGNHIKIDTVMINGLITIPNRTLDTLLNGGTPIMDFFVALVQDTQTNGLFCESEDIFTNPAGDTLLATNPLKNLYFAKRFITLKTWHLAPAMPTSTTTATDIQTLGQTIPFSCYLNVEIPVSFNSSGNFIGDVVDNSLFLVAFRNGQASGATMSWNSRIRFRG